MVEEQTEGLRCGGGFTEMVGDRVEATWTHWKGNLYQVEILGFNQYL